MKRTCYTLPNVPVRLLLLSDLHNELFDSAALREEKADLICVCGDVFYSFHPLSVQRNVLPFLRSCAEHAPTLFSLGNHEQAITGEEIKRIEGTGAVVLDNRWVEMEIGNRRVVVGGLSSGYATAYRKWRAENPGREKPERGEITDRHPETGWLDSFAAAPGYHILLSHHPEYYPLVMEHADLVLCGHAHGGQWRIGRKGVYAPGQGIWPKWTKGIYDGRMVVSAGLSNPEKVPRLFNPTEIVIVEPA